MSAAAEGGAKPASDAQAGERDRQRAALFAQNAAVWRAGASAAPQALDASLKRNSTFIKRVRQGNVADAKDQLLRDIDTLNLGKYLDELVPSLPELLWRSTTLKDRLAAVELIASLHRRYGAEAFTIPLTRAVSAQLIPPNLAALNELSAEQREKDEAARLGRQRVLLRGAAELALTGLLGTEVPEDDDAQRVAAMSHDVLYNALRGLVRGRR